MPHADSRSYTVREIATILVDQEVSREYSGYQDQLEKRLRQVRHWTACDYLRPIGKKHSGTGVARRYGADEVRKAALLRELTRFGLTVTQLGEEFGESLEKRAAQKEWQQAIEGKPPIYYQIILPAGATPDQSGYMMNLVPTERSLLRFLDPKYVAAKKRKRARGPKRSGVNDIPTPDFVSGLTISLTQLFATLEL